jgi:hypothetical protein
MPNTACDELYQELERNHLTPLWRAEPSSMIEWQGAYSAVEGDRVYLELGGGEYAAHTP